MTQKIHKKITTILNTSFSATNNPFVIRDVMNHPFTTLTKINTENYNSYNITGIINVTLKDKWLNVHQDVSITKKIYNINNEVFTRPGSSTNAIDVTNKYKIPIIYSPYVLKGHGDIIFPDKIGDVIIDINIILPENNQ
jgi:hypothetical protein